MMTVVMRLGMLRVLFGLIAVIFVAASAVKSDAHDAHFVLTSVEWNRNTTAIEIIHRFHAHHALDAMASRDRSTATAFDNPESFAALQARLEAAFAIKSAGGDIVPLSFVGAELQGDFLLMYQESEPLDRPGFLDIKNDFLADIFEDQVIHVNVSLGGRKETLIFNRNRRGMFLRAGDEGDDLPATPQD